MEEPIARQETIGPVRADPRSVRQRLAGPATLLLVFAIQLIVVWPVAVKRGFDGDEGFYAIAAKLVAHGQEPYFDFWFQHAPGLPYVYGAWTRLTGESFESLRALSALLTAALGVVLYMHVARRFTRRLGIAATALYITSALVFSWFTTYKSYVLSTLLVFVAYVLVAASDRDEPCRAARWFAAGAVLGLSIDVRLFFLALVPVFAYYAMDRKGPRAERVAKIPALLGGVAVGLLPCIYFFARDPRRFISDTLLSQTSRSEVSLLDSVVQKLRTADTLLGGAQFLVLVGAAVTLTALVFVTRRRLPLAVAIAGALAVASLIPTPTYDQYFSTLVPFLVVGTIELWHAIRTTLPRPADKRLALVVRTVGLAGLLLYVVAGAGAYDQMMNSDAALRSSSNVRRISDAVDARTRDGETVIDFAPIDLYESDAEPLPGLESDFGTGVAANLELSDEEAARDKMVTIGRLEEIVRSGRIRTVVLRPVDSYLFPRPWATIVSESGYRPVATIGDLTIYQRPKP